jgi:hypothetical protein
LALFGQRQAHGSTRACSFAVDRVAIFHIGKALFRNVKLDYAAPQHIFSLGRMSFRIMEKYS